MKRQRGFTLLELMVAVGILAVLGLAASTLLGTTLANQSQLRERGQALEDLALSLALIRRDLEQISYRPGRDVYGDTQESVLRVFADSDSLRLELTRTGRRQFPGTFVGSSLERVRYRLEQNRLYRETTPVADPLPHSQWLKQPLLEQVKSLRFEFFDGEGWQAQWPALGNESRVLPKAIAVIVDTDRWQDVRLQVLLPQSVSHES